MKTRVLQWIAVALITGILGACASSNSGSVYSRDEARKAQTVKTGVVESVRAVKLEGTKSPVGTIAGGAVGGIAGSSIGGGRGSAIAAVIGAVAGGLGRLRSRRGCHPQERAGNHRQTGWRRLGSHRARG